MIFLTIPLFVGMIILFSASVIRRDYFQNLAIIISTITVIIQAITMWIQLDYAHFTINFVVLFLILGVLGYVSKIGNRIPQRIPFVSAIVLLQGSLFFILNSRFTLLELVVVIACMGIVFIFFAFYYQLMQFKATFILTVVALIFSFLIFLLGTLWIVKNGWISWGSFPISLPANILHRSRAAFIFVIGLYWMAGGWPLNIWILPTVYNEKLYVAPFVIYQIFRLSLLLTIGFAALHFFPESTELFNIFIILGVASILTGSIYCFSKIQINRILMSMDFISMGLLAISFGIFTLRSMMAFYAYGLINFLAFNVIFLFFASIFLDSNPVNLLTKLPPLQRSTSLRTFAFFLALLAIIGLPPSMGFWFLVNFYVSLYNTQIMWIGLFSFIGTLLLAIYCLRILYYMSKQSNAHISYRIIHHTVLQLIYLAFIAINISIFIWPKQLFFLFQQIFYTIRGY